MTQRRRHQVRPEQRPCPPLTHWGIAIVRASYQLPIAAKLVLELLRELDRGDGAFLAPAQAAAQLGMGQRYFEEVRAGLVRLGLVVQVPVEGSRLDFWFPRLPHGFESEPPAGATREIRMAWIRQWADALDLALERGKAASKWYRPERGKAAHYSAEKPRSPDPLSAALPTPERGEAAPIEHENARSAPPSETLTAVIQGVSQSSSSIDAIASGRRVRQDNRTLDERKAAFREAAERERLEREQREAQRIP